MSNVHAEIFNNSIQINIHIPLTSQEKFKLYTFTPVPFQKDGNTFILNSEQKIIIRNDSFAAEIPTAAIVRCAQMSTLTICDELLCNEILPLNDCVNAMVNNNDTKALCVYTQLQNKNQVVKISDEFLYIYIKKPMLFKVSCGQNENIYNLNESTEIYYGKYCKLSTKMDNYTQGATVTLFKISPKFTEPNFAIFSNNSWNGIKCLNEHNIEIQKLINEIREARVYFNENSKILDIPNTDIFSILPDFLLNKMIQFVLLYIVLPISIVIMFTCCICRYTK